MHFTIGVTLDNPSDLSPMVRYLQENLGKAIDYPLKGFPPGSFLLVDFGMNRGRSQIILNLYLEDPFGNADVVLTPCGAVPIFGGRSAMELIHSVFRLAEANEQETELELEGIPW